MPANGRGKLGATCSRRAVQRALRNGKPMERPTLLSGELDRHYARNAYPAVSVSRNLTGYHMGYRILA